MLPCARRGLDPLEDAEIKRLVARLLDPGLSLKTDKFLWQREPSAKGRAQLRLRVPVLDSIRLTRRAMEVGIYEVERTKRERIGPISYDLERVRSLAADAEKSIAKLIAALDPNAGRSADLEIAILTTLDNAHVLSARRAHFTARQHAKHLWRARYVSERLAGDALARAARLTRGYQNPGKPEHRLFADCLAKAWAHIFGVAPSGSRNATRNPFLSFTRIAWKEAFQTDDEPEFVGAAQHIAISAIEIRRLIEIGPPWA